MVKYSQEYNLVKMAAFEDEFEKLGGWQAIAKFLGNAIKGMSRSPVGKTPGSKFFQFGEKLTGADKYKTFGDAYGSGLKWLEKNLPYRAPIYRAPTAAEKLDPNFGRVETVRSKVDNWVRGITGQTPNPKKYKNIRTTFGAGDKGNIKKVLVNDPNAPVAPSMFKDFGGWTKHHTGRMFGQGVHNLRRINDVGLSPFLKNHWGSHQLFSRTNKAGQSILVDRSPLGRVVNPALTSGVGFGAMTALPSKTPEGRPRGMAERVGSGVAETAGWTLVPQAYMTKLIGYDLPKSLLS